MEVEVEEKVAIQAPVQPQLELSRSVTIKMEDIKGPLHSLFFGKIQRQIYYDNEGKRDLSSKNDEEFMSIFLNPSDSSEFYSAWEKEFRAPVEVIDDGKEKKGECITWICELPESMLFSICRAQRGEEEGKSHKLNQKFEFEETIYADRFMLENEEEATKVAGEVAKLRNRIAEIDKALEKFK